MRPPASKLNVHPNTAGGEKESGHTNETQDIHPCDESLDRTERRMREFMDKMSHDTWAQEAGTP